VAPTDRVARDHRRGHVHGGTQAVRLHRARRSHGARLLRVRRDRRQCVRAARVDPGDRVVRRPRGRAPGMRDPPREQRA
jgi:hypothetical protein